MKTYSPRAAGSRYAKRHLLRAVSFLTSTAFLLTSITGNGNVWAQGLSVQGSAEVRGLGLTQDAFGVPSDLGTLRDFARPSSEEAPFVFHIQDAHANVDAQKSIQGLLAWLSRQPEGSRMTVYLEGVSGTIHPEYLRLFPEYPEINEAVVQDLASKGELNGVELFAWESLKNGVSQEAFRVEGVEETELYRDNLTTYREVLGRQDEIAALVSPLDKQLELAKSRILSPALRDFLKERDRRKMGHYQSESSSPQLAAYVTYLAGQVKKELQIDLEDRFEQVRFPNLVRLLVLEQLEKNLDRAAAERERAKAVESLMRRAGTEEEKTMIRDFDAMDASMDARRIAESVWAWAAEKRVDLRPYREMWKNAGSIVLRSEVQGEALFSEMDILESWLVEKWIKNGGERKLLGLLRDAELIEKLLALKWTPSDEQAYLARPAEVLESVFGNTLSEMLEKNGEAQASKRLAVNTASLRSEVERALHFYETARERDAIILDRTLAPGQEGRLKVLVSGGFHTTGLTQLLREQGAGYAVVQPHIRRNDNGQLYHNALKEKNNDVSAYFNEPVLNKQQALFFKAYMETALPLLWEKYQVPHSEMAQKIASAMQAHPVLSGAVTAEAKAEGTSSRLEVTPRISSEPVSFAEQGVALPSVTGEPGYFSRAWAAFAGLFTSSQTADQPQGFSALLSPAGTTARISRREVLKGAAAAVTAAGLGLTAAEQAEAQQPPRLAQRLIQRRLDSAYAARVEGTRPNLSSNAVENLTLDEITKLAEYYGLNLEPKHKSKKGEIAPVVPFGQGYEPGVGEGPEDALHIKDEDLWFRIFRASGRGQTSDSLRRQFFVQKAIMATADDVVARGLEPLSPLKQAEIVQLARYIIGLDKNSPYAVPDDASPARYFDPETPQHQFLRTIVRALLLNNDRSNLLKFPDYNTRLADYKHSDKPADAPASREDQIQFIYDAAALLGLSEQSLTAVNEFTMGDATALLDIWLAKPQVEVEINGVKRQVPNDEFNANMTIGDVMIALTNRKRVQQIADDAGLSMIEGMVSYRSAQERKKLGRKLTPDEIKAIQAEPYTRLATGDVSNFAKPFIALDTEMRRSFQNWAARLDQALTQAPNDAARVNVAREFERERQKAQFDFARRYVETLNRAYQDISRELVERSSRSELRTEDKEIARSLAGGFNRERLMAAFDILRSFEKGKVSPADMGGGYDVLDNLGFPVYGYGEGFEIPRARAIVEEALSIQRAPRSELRQENWVALNTPELVNYTVVSRQFEAGLNRDILEAIEAKYGRAIANFVSQSNFTGGLGALMPDLIDSWKKNGTDIVAVHPLYNDKIKGIVRDLPEEITSGRKKLGDYLREILTDLGGDTGIEFKMKLPIGDDFRNRAQGKARGVVDQEMTVHVYKINTRFGGTPSYYLDIYYQGADGQPVRVFDEVYPDSDAGSMLWRDVHMGTYALATEKLIQILQQRGEVKQNLLFVDNEVFASMPTPLLPNALHHHINHTVFRPGLYRPDESSFEMLGYPEWMRPLIVRDGKINVTDAVALSSDLITGVGLYEHTPVLGQGGIFSGHLHKLSGYNLDGVRSTNGVLLDQWQTPEKRALIQQYKAKLSLSQDTSDRDFFTALNANEALLNEFQVRSEYINAAYVGLFFNWLAVEQKNPVWLDAAAAETARRTGQPVTDAAQHVNDFLAAVRAAFDNEADWEKVKAFDAFRDVLIEDPIVSNVRRQVPYKGPEKWIEVLESLVGKPEAIEDFRKNSARVVIGGRIFDQGAYNTFQRIKDLVQQLGLQDRIVTVENYSIQTAPIIFQAMSGVVMLSDEFLEASATSMMKGLTNFARLIGVWGGADPELFTIIETATGREIDVFGENVSHDQLVQNLDNGSWKITNGYLVRYADEASRQMGGGRRPSAASLAQALKDLKKDYSSTESRRQAQYDAVASSPKVDIETSQARAHAYLWESAIKASQRNAALQKEIKIPVSAAEKLLRKQDSGFGWTRRPDINRPDTVLIEQSQPGLNGFLEGFRRLRMRGLEALWSLSYHATNTAVSPQGDVFNYILGVLLPSDEPALMPARQEIERLAKLAAETADVNAKVELNLQAYEVLDQFAMQLSRSLLERFASGEEAVGSLLGDPLVRESLVRQLDKSAAPLSTTVSGVHSYAVELGGQKVIVSINSGAFVLSREQDQKAWATVFGVDSLSAVLGADALRDVGSIYEAQDVVTGESYRRFSVTDLVSKGLPIGIPADSNVQVLRLAKPQEQKLIEYFSAAVKEEFIGGSQIPANLLVDEIKKLRSNPAQLKQVLENVARGLTPEDARRLFSDAQGRPVGVPAVMSFIAALSPDLLRYMREWDTAVYNQIDAAINNTNARDVFDRGEIQFHRADQKQAIVFSRVLGNRHVVVPVYFGTRPYSQADGKVWIRVRENLNVLGVENANKNYTVQDHLLNQTYPGTLNGADLYRQGWGIGIPVLNNGPHFQMLSIAPARSELRTVEDFRIEEKVQLDGLNPEQRRVLDLLVAEGQTQLFDKWAAAGTDEEQKRAFLDQASELDKTYPGGLAAYRANAVKLLTASARGENPLAGFSPAVPELVDLTKLNADFESRQERGLARANKLAFVMVAGGLGERLGYDGIKIAIPQSLLTGQTYAEWYGRNIKAFQDRANAQSGESAQIPFVIMTSNDTDARTRELLAETGNLGLAPDQIKIVKQGAVPALVNNNADFVTEPENPYELQTKPHGHGDVHMLIHRDDLAKQWKAQGVTHVVFIQDTNGQVFNSVLPGLTVSQDLGLDMNFFTVPRDAGEAAGAITKLTHTDGRVMVGNVEYNQLGPLLKATVNPAGDVADEATGYSPYPGNLNVFAVELDAYLGLLDQTQGVIQEFINPKYADETKTKFKSPTRSETMMQDAAFAMPGKVGATNFDKRTVFSPVKNNLADGASKRDAMATGESDFYKGFRRQLEAAGVKITVAAPERVTRGVKYEDGAKVVLDPSFAVTQTDVREKVQGGAITNQSSLVVEGAGVKLENLNLDGALRIRAVPGANVVIRNLTVKNQGARFVDLTDEEMADESVPAYLKIRGYRLETAEEVVINVTAPGNYVFDGETITGPAVIQGTDGTNLVRSELRTTPAGFNVEEKINVGGLNPEQRRVLDLLIAEGQTQLFDKWAAAGTDEEQKRAFLDQASELDRTYPGGLAAYRANAVKLLTASAEGKNPLAGFSPSVPELVDLTRLNADFEVRQEQGLAGANKLAFVMVAGGLGERLGYDGIKIAIPQSLLTGQTYAEWYGRNIKAFQDRANAENGESVQVPFVIMTSNDTDARTRELLAETGNLGLAREQIKIVKQGAVPALVNNNADFVTEPENPYELQTKPHGHGDVHMLIHRDDLAKQWKAQGVTHVVFIQDTNGQVFNSVLPGLTVSKELGLDMNFFTVPRDAGEAAGAITKLTHTDGRVMVGNVEYNQLGPLLKATVNPAGDVADPATGYSPYPGNLNVFALEIDAYLALLDQTQGVIQEFINPKYADETKTKFKSPTRSETMMQDAAFAMPGKVGATNFDKRTVFSPVKNNLVDGASKRDAMATGESDFYKGFRRQLEAAGVNISVVGPERITRGVKYEDGAKVVLDPSFAVTQTDVRDKVRGGWISNRSSLVVEGAGVKLQNLNLNGALKIRAVPGANVVIRNLTVENDGVQLVDLTDDEMADESVPAYLKIRGYRLEVLEELVINVTAPGNYVIDGDSVIGGGVYEPKDGVLTFRSELRELPDTAVSAVLPAAVPTAAAPVRSELRDLLLPETVAGQVPVVSTRETIRTVAPVVEAARGEAYAMSTASRELAEAAVQSVYATAEALSSQLGISREEALTAILVQLLPQETADSAQWNRALETARQELGDALASRFIDQTGDNPFHFQQVVSVENLQREEDQLMIAFTLLSRRQHSMTFFLPPDDDDEPISTEALERLREAINAKARSLGGANIKADRLTLIALPTGSEDQVRKAMIRETQGVNGDLYNIVLHRTRSFLEAFGVVKGLSRVDRGQVGYSEANYLAGALLGQKDYNELGIFDLQNEMRRMGYSEEVVQRISRMIQALQKIAVAA